MPDNVVTTVHHLAKTTIVGLPFQNRRREPIESADVDNNPVSTGVIDDETEETDCETDDEEEEDEDEDAMPGLQKQDAYDSDSDDEEEEYEDVAEEDNDDEEQSAGVLDDESTGVEVETVE
jgi:hypothetical protein